MRIFGFDVSKKTNEELSTFALDRSLTSEAAIPDTHFNDHAGIMSVPYEALQVPKDELDLVNSYRELAGSSEIDEALQEIRNEIFIYDVPGKKAFEIDFVAESELSEKIRLKISEEFDEVYKLIDFDVNGTQWFDDWYVDSKLFLYKMVDYNNLKKGIRKVQFIDPLKIRLVRILPKLEPDGTYNRSDVREFFVYNNFNPSVHPVNQIIQLQYGSSIQGIQIKPESIAHINSGLFDRQSGKYVGYLKKAIVPFNMLKMMEDAMVIFRVVRAPARRAFYVDVSGLQKNKAEAYIRDVMSKFKNKMVYDTKSGTLADKRNVMSMMEDYWLPRREGKSTEVSVIEGQNSNEIMEEIEYLRDRLWRSLGVPRGRFGEQQNTQLFGRGNELSRDEYRFTKYLSTLRSRFILIIEDLLKTQLILKKIISDKDWETVRRDIIWQYTDDNNFVEAKEIEVLNNRLNLLNSIDPLVGKYYSKLWAQKNVLRMTLKEIEEEDAQMAKEGPPPGEEMGAGSFNTDQPDDQADDQNNNQDIE